MKIEEVKNLAEKARIDMTDDEMNEVAKDFDSILEYVSQIEKTGIGENLSVESNLKNVFREDLVTNENKKFSDSLIDEMPDSENGYLKVKKIL